MKKTLLFFSFTQIFFSQGIELMQNNYPTNPSGIPFPDATVSLYACLTGSSSGVNGVPITLGWHQYVGWGAHTHEAVNFVGRPEPIVIGSVIQLTGFAGNAPGCVSWEVIFNGFAGGYTFWAQSPGFPTKGINYITRQYEFLLRTTPTFFQPYSGDGWPGSPLNSSATFPDTRHYPGTSRFVSSSAYPNFLAMSTAYKNDTTQQGIADLLSITRISLPDGGIYDNDVNGISPGPDQSTGDWQARTFEEHGRGVEADIYVPSGTLRQNAAFASITANNCYVGLYAPNGTPLGDRTAAQEFWRQKFIMHVTCRNGMALKGGPRTRPN